MTSDNHLKPIPSAAATEAQAAKKPPLLFECKLCGKVFDGEQRHPACPECDSNDVEQVG